MASESIARSAFGLMGYLLRAHSGSRNNVKYSLVKSRQVDKFWWTSERLSQTTDIEPSLKNDNNKMIIKNL